MAKIKSLSIPDTNCVPVNGGSVIVRSELVSTDRNDALVGGPDLNLWTVTQENTQIDTSPFLVTLDPDGGVSSYSLKSNYTIPTGSTFTVESVLEIERLDGPISDGFIAQFLLTDGVKFVSVSYVIDDFLEVSELRVETDEGSILTQGYDLKRVKIAIAVVEDSFHIFINGEEDPFASGSIEFLSSVEVVIEALTETDSLDTVGFSVKSFKSVPVVTGVPSLNLSGLPVVGRYSDGELRTKVYPGSPGQFELVVHGSGTNVGSSEQIGTLKILNEPFGEDSLKFLSSYVEKFYDDFNRSSICPAAATPDILNPSKNVIVHNRCICDGSNSQDEVEIQIRRSGELNQDRRGVDSVRMAYRDSEGKTYRDNFSFDRVILPTPELDAGNPIKNLRALQLSNGNILHYGVVNEPLANNERDVHITLQLKRINDEEEEPPEYKLDYTLLSLSDNSTVLDFQGSSGSATAIINQTLPVGRYLLRVYDSNAEIRLDSGAGPILDKESDIESRYDYNFQFGSSSWPEGPVPEGFEYLSEKKYVEFAFDVKRYNGQFVGYLHDICSGHISKITSVYNDINLTTESYSVVESDSGSLHLIYLPIANEEVYNSRASKLRVREIDLDELETTENYVDISFNRDSERVLGDRPRLSLITGEIGTPIYLGPTNFNLSIRTDFIHSFDVVRTGANVEAFISWGTFNNTETRESHRLYKKNNRRLRVQFGLDGEPISGFYQPQIDGTGSAECYYSQSPAVSSDVEVFSLSVVGKNDFQELSNIWDQFELRAPLLTSLPIVSFENVYNYTRNFIKNTHEDILAGTLIDVFENEAELFPVIDNSYRYTIKSVGPSYIKASYDPENKIVVLSMLDFSKRIPVTMGYNGKGFDICSPLHFSSINFIKTHTGEVFESYSSCIGADGFVYSAATSNTRRRSVEIGITDPSILSDLSNTYVFENIANVRENERYVKSGNVAFYRNDFIDYVMPCFNSFRQHRGLTGIDINRVNGYLMMSGGSSSSIPFVAVSGGQDVFPFSIQPGQVFLPDIEKVSDARITFNNVGLDGYRYNVENTGSYVPRVTVNIAHVNPMRYRLNEGYRFHYRVENTGEQMIDPYSFSSFVSRDTTHGAGFKVKFYGNTVKLYRMSDLTTEHLLATVEDIPEGIVDIYLMAKAVSPVSNTCKVCLIIKQPDHLTLFREEGVHAFNFKNSYYREVLEEVTIIPNVFHLILSQFEDEGSIALGESVAIHQIDYSVLSQKAGAYTYTDLPPDAAGEVNFGNSFFINSTKLSRKIDDGQVFHEGTIPDHFFSLVHRYDRSGLTYERHWPYGFVTSFRGGSVKLRDKWSLGREVFASSSLDPFNVHTAWSSDSDEEVGHIWAFSEDSGLDSFTFDTVLIEDINVPAVEIVGRNLPGDSWEVVGSISMLRYAVEVETVQESEAGFVITLRGGELMDKIGETFDLRQDGIPFRVIKVDRTRVYVGLNGNEVPTPGSVHIYSSKGSIIFDSIHKFRYVGIRIPAGQTYEGHFRVGAVAIGKYNEIPIEYNHDLNSGVDYSLEVSSRYMFDNQSYFRFNKGFVKNYMLRYSISDSISYAKFRTVISNVGVSRAPIWIIDRHSVDDKEFSLCMLQTGARAEVVRDDEEIYYTIDMAFRSIK
jgi:hypothetical protein